MQYRKHGGLVYMKTRLRNILIALHLMDSPRVQLRRRLRERLQLWRERWQHSRPEHVDVPRVSIIPFNQAVICLSCRAISDGHGSACASCAETGTLISLARILQPTPELGRVC